MLLSSLRSFRQLLPLPVQRGYGWLRRRFARHPLLGNAEFKRYYQWLLDTEW